MIDPREKTTAISGTNPSASNIPFDALGRLGRGAPEQYGRQVVSVIEGAAAQVAADEVVRQPIAPRSRKTEASPEDASYREFRRIVDSLLSELNDLLSITCDGKIPEEGAGRIVEIQDLLEKLYYVPWGEKECLKRVVLAMHTQTNNIEWQPVHAQFLKTSLRVIRARFNIDDGLVREIQAIARSFQLDPFRGTLAEPTVIRKYRIQEIEK